MSQWVFARLSGAAVRRDPQETELFKTEDASEGEYAGTDALVREVIQNSMDAGVGDSPVRVRFSLHSNDALPSEQRLATYFQRLAPGIFHRDIEFDAAGVPQLDAGFLVCEDFGTRGLGGDPLRATDPPLGTSGEDFFWFWRNIGRSGKTGDDLGRWGLGKTVYRAASRVGCMLGLTVRHEDGKRLLMGQAVLKIHQHEGTEYAAEGYWCDGCNEANTPLPIDSSSSLQDFTDEWKLSRTNEPGLSVVVPYVANELKAESILRLAVVNFFLPILQGKLIVDVAGPGLPRDSTEYRVDHDSIERICKELAWTGRVRQKLSAPPPIAFARECIAVADDATPTDLLGQERVPSMSEAAFDADTIRSLRERFANEELVAIRVRASLPRKQGEAEVGELNVYLQRTPTNDRFESYYVREGMTITRLNSKPSLRGTRGLVAVEPGPLASLLGDTEGPAHISWDTSNDERPNRIWKTWKGRVKFFAKIIDSMVELLSPPPEKADFDLLSDFFSIEQFEAPQRRKKTKKGGTDNTREFAAPDPTPRWYRLVGKAGGFQICDSNQLPTQIGALLRVSVAYDLPNGNPMKHWSKFDFDFRKGKLNVEGKGVLAVAKGGNLIAMKIKKADFHLTVTGFDIHRDLIVRIDEVLSDEPASEVPAEAETAS